MISAILLWFINDRIVYISYVEHENVHIACHRNECVSILSGMVPKSRTTDAATISSVSSVDLHIVTADSRCYDRPSSSAGIFSIFGSLPHNYFELIDRW